MAILTIADKDDFFPDVEASGQSLIALINRCQTLAESSKGSNRPLEIKKHTETIPVPSSGVVLLSRTPVITNSVQYPITVQIRWFASVNNQYYFPGVDDWQEIVNNDYFIDYDTGEIKLRAFFNQYSRFIPSSGYSYSVTNPIARRNRALGRFQPPQIKISYYTGFDFSADPLTSDAANIKNALAAMVNFLGSAGGQAASQGINNFQLNNFYTVGYSPNSVGMTLSGGVNSPVEEFLSVFRQYQPKSFTTR